MRTNYILIDFENVQPSGLSELSQDHFHVLVFAGNNQTKVPIDIAIALQPLGTRVEYIKANGTGPNAVDFHIAFYIGHLASRQTDAFFHIVSKDTGFDPLIAHLKTKKILADRVTAIADIPIIKAAHATTPTQRIDLVLQRLRTPASNKPRTTKTLTSMIHSLFQKTLTEDELQTVVQGVIQSLPIHVTDNKLTYD